MGNLSGRNYGIDLLKIICMGMVVMIHVLGHGGILYNTTMFTIQYSVLWALECAIYCAVNCYALITGYLYYGRTFKYSNILRLYFQVAFYGVIIFFLFYFLHPDMVSSWDLARAILPFATVNQYWYFTSYFYLFFLMPFLNKMMATSTKKEATVLLTCLFVFFSIVPTFSTSDPIQENSGYSMLWLMIMYLLGAYIKKYDVVGKLKSWQSLLGYFINVLLLWLSRCGVEYVMQLWRDGSWVNRNFIFFKYSSPLLFLCAVFLFLLFASLKIPKGLQKPVAFLAPLSFGVYLLHDNPLIRQYFMIDKFKFLLYEDLWKLLLAVIGIALAIWAVGTAVDFARSLIFKLLHISQLCDWIDSKVNKLMEKVTLKVLGSEETGIQKEDTDSA